MAIEFENNNQVMLIHLPNSEATVNAQHHGIKDTSVCAYYMSERNTEVYDFLNDLSGEYYLDLALIFQNALDLINSIEDSGMTSCFKMKLAPQKNAIEALKWMLASGTYFPRIPNPTVNDNQKYLRFDNQDKTLTLFRDLCLGEVSDICIKKVGKDGFLIYMQKSKNFNATIKTAKNQWVKND